MTIPTQTERDQAQWALLQAQIEQARRQARWETPKAVAMVALALAALFAASRLADLVLPARPQQIIVHIEGPVPVTPIRP